MPKPYSQLLAALAVAKASLVAMLRSPTSVVFSLLFPIIFIVVFGAMVDNNAPNLQVCVAPSCDTSNAVYQAVREIKMFHLVTYSSASAGQAALAKGRIAAILDIQPDSRSSMARSPYRVFLQTAQSSAGGGSLASSALRDLIARADSRQFPTNVTIAVLSEKVMAGRIYRSIDFILPGQLGFSLLMAGVFGSAFLFFNLRQSLVLKRFFATPIRPRSLILGEMLSRLFFQVIGFVLMVALGYFAFHFTLVNGFYTFLEMLLFSLLGLIIFMGIGFIISGFIENESSIAPVANTITLPQILLCGLFFPIENYPGWLQAFCKLLPLTFFVDGLRKIAFEGTHFWQMPLELAGLSVWALVVGLFTVKVFRWE